jgi:tetratricopeptide (TPR) repeat protein
VNLGIALADQYDLGGALEQFSEAVRLAPRSPTAHYNKGRVLYDTGKHQEAREELETACRLLPDYPAALYLLAHIERRANNVTRSAELLQKVIALDPRNSDAQYLLGQNLLQLGKTDEAVRCWQVAVEANPNNSEALYGLAKILSKQGKPQAKLYLERFQALEESRQLTDRIQQLGNFGLEAANARNWDQAVAQITEALELCKQCPQRADLHRNLGLIYCRKGDLENGYRELRIALKLRPDDADALKAIEILESAQKRKTPPN